MSDFVTLKIQDNECENNKFKYFRVVRLLKSTEKALCFLVSYEVRAKEKKYAPITWFGGNLAYKRIVWFPISLIQKVDDFQYLIPDWLVKQEGLNFVPYIESFISDRD